jgi:midasin (ATPase involved in ribosome maturation)
VQAPAFQIGISLHFPFMELPPLPAQNPNSGLFKGKREQLSQSLLSRFLPVTFNELPRDEWEDIIERKFVIDADDPLAELFVSQLSKTHSTAQ